jgi:hypothetical protein
MKSRIAILFSFAVFMLLMTACESFMSDVDGLDSEPKLVVNAYLSPEDDTIKVTIRRSYPLYQLRPDYFEQFDPVRNATVILSQGNNAVTVPFSDLYQSYVIAQSSFPIIAGNTYRIEVRGAGLQTVTAECTVPVQLPPPIEITGIEQVSEYDYIEYKVNFRFRDYSEPGHFYRVAAGQEYNFPEMGMRELWEIGIEGSDALITDVSRQGEYFSFKTNRFGMMNNQQRVYLFLGLTDEHYFRFHKSVFSYESGNPFAEPTPVYSNISGGLGVFSAVRKSIVMVPLP